MQTQYITDAKGKKIAVILPVKEYEKMMEELEVREDIVLYDKAKKEDDGKRILLDDYIKNRKKKNAININIFE